MLDPSLPCLTCCSPHTYKGNSHLPTLQRRTPRLRKVHCLLRIHSLGAGTVNTLISTNPERADNHSGTGSPFLQPYSCLLEPKKASFMGSGESWVPCEEAGISSSTSRLQFLFEAILIPYHQFDEKAFRVLALKILHHRRLS